MNQFIFDMDSLIKLLVLALISQEWELYAQKLFLQVTLGLIHER